MMVSIVTLMRRWGKSELILSCLWVLVLVMVRQTVIGNLEFNLFLPYL